MQFELGVGKAMKEVCGFPKHKTSKEGTSRSFERGGLAMRSLCCP